MEILPSPSILFDGMEGAVMPITVAHGEGQVQYRNAADADTAMNTLRFVNGHGIATEHYPENPNGSLWGQTGFCSTDGRANILMPHPKRVWRRSQFSWAPAVWSGEVSANVTLNDDSPWLRMFENARRFVG